MEAGWTVGRGGLNNFTALAWWWIAMDLAWAK
jgi:hypothetical protein